MPGSSGTGARLRLSSAPAAAVRMSRRGACLGAAPRRDPGGQDHNGRPDQDSSTAGGTDGSTTADTAGGCSSTEVEALLAVVALLGAAGIALISHMRQVTTRPTTAPRGATRPAPPRPNVRAACT